jgi:hypothetical protein
MPDINFGNSAGGLGKLAAALGGGSAPGGAYGKAYDNELGLQSKLAQALAAIEASGATARLHTLQGDEAQGQLDARRPEAMLGNVLTTNGIPTDEAGAVGGFLKTGQLGGKYRAPADGNGPVAPAPDWQDKLGAVARSLGNMQGAITLGGKNIEDVAKANAIGTNEERKGAVINGKLDPVRLAQAEYAGKGSAPFSFHEFGTGNNLTGQVDDQSGPAQRFGQYRGAETGAANARAGAANASATSSYASAAHSRALTDKTRQDIEMGSKGVLQQTDQGLLLVNPRDGTSQPVVGPNGAPAGKPAALAKALPASAAKGYLENLQNMERAQKALDLVTGSNVGSSNGDTEATGLKGYLPNTVLNRVDPQGVDARAALSDIGSMVIHDRSGAAVSASEFPRLQPFIPSVRDDAATVKKKLKLFVDNYKAIVDDQGEFYRGSGYNVPALTRRNVATPPGKTPAAAPQGFTYLGKE